MHFDMMLEYTWKHTRGSTHVRGTQLTGNNLRTYRVYCITLHQYSFGLPVPLMSRIVSSVSRI